jgi:hypothetical protein
VARSAAVSVAAIAIAAARSAAAIAAAGLLEVGLGDVAQLEVRRVLRELDATLDVGAEALDRDHVADADDVRDTLDEARRELADVDETFLTR